MAMTFEFDIRPFGYQNNGITFGRMRVHAAGSRHEYTVEYKDEHGWREIHGSVPRAKSGHRNFLHLLAAIMDDIDLDALGVDYVHILTEIEIEHPIVKEMRISDY